MQFFHVPKKVEAKVPDPEKTIPGPNSKRTGFGDFFLKELEQKERTLKSWLREKRFSSLDI